MLRFLLSALFPRHYLLRGTTKRCALSCLVLPKRGNRNNSFPRVGIEFTSVAFAVRRGPHPPRLSVYKGSVQNLIHRLKTKKKTEKEIK